MIAPLSASSSALSQQPARSDGDSDSDWDDDDDFVTKKINIKIKPIAQMTPGKISASMDELRATVGTWKSMGNINLVKPNSRRSQYIPPQPIVPQPIATIQPKISYQPSFPVALAVQEFLDVRTPSGLGGENFSNLTGHIKMAVPRKIIEMDVSQFLSNDLMLDISTSKAWSDYQIDERFVRKLPMDLNGNDQSGLYYFSNNETQPMGQCFMRISLNMQMVHLYFKELSMKQSNSNYFLLPELIKYKICNLGLNECLLDDAKIKSSMSGKTISETHLALSPKQNQGTINYLITKQKFEVRTNRSKHEPERYCLPLLV